MPSRDATLNGSFAFEVSLNAFHVNVGQKATTAGSSMIRAALAGEALQKNVFVTADRRRNFPHMNIPSSTLK